MYGADAKTEAAQSPHGVCDGHIFMVETKVLSVHELIDTDSQMGYEGSYQDLYIEVLQGFVKSEVDIRYI